MHSSRQLVVDAGAGHVAGGVFSRSAEGKLTLEEFALETRISDPSLEAGWMEGTAKALASVAMRQKLRGPATLAVPGHLTLTKFVKMPAVAPARRARVVQIEAAQAIPYPLDAVAWDHLVVAGDERDVEIMLTAVKLEVMESLCAAAESAGFSVKRAASSCLALHRAFGFNYPGVSVPVLVVDIGARSTNLVLAAPGGRFFARTFAFAGNAATAAVAAELNVDFAGAEALKLRARPAPAEEKPAELAAVQRATATFSGRLEMEIVRTVGNFCLRMGGEKPETIYLTGGGSLLDGLAGILAGKLQVPVERYDPLRHIELSESARAAGAESAAHLLPNLIGLAVPPAATQDSETGLLPPAIRSARAFRRHQPFILGAATLLAVALLAPIRHYHRLAAVQAERAAEVAAQLPALRESVKRNAEALAALTTMQREIAALRRVTSAKSNWIDFLADLQDRLGQVEDVWLEQLAVIPTPPAGVPGKAVLAATTPALQLRLSGRLLDVRNPVSMVSPDSYARVKQLLAGFARSPFIAAIEDERFDNAQPGLLRFDFTVVVNPSHPL